MIIAVQEVLLRENIISNDRQYILIEQHTNQVSLKERLNGDGQQFHQCQQNKQSPITTSTEHFFMNVNKNYPALHVFVVDLIPSVL
jgi:hypothetical protein